MRKYSNNGARFATYAIRGNGNDAILNGAAARLIQPGDIILILTYCSLSETEIANHKPKIDEKPTQLCPDCKGESEVLLFNLMHKCETCNGTGSIQAETD